MLRPQALRAAAHLARTAFLPQVFSMNGDAIRLLVGLGNPGPQYVQTRHNIGFMALDALARVEGLTWRTRGRGQETIWHAAGNKVVLLKPLTYMNLSGFALTDTMAFHKIPLAQTAVLSDDVALPLGTLRMRPSGSAGGHNGLKHIIEQTGTQDFWRLRLGVGGKKHPGQELTDHVLGRFSPQELPAVQDLLTRTLNCLTVMTTEGPQLAMSRFNTSPTEKKKEKPADPQAVAGVTTPEPKGQE